LFDPREFLTFASSLLRRSPIQEVDVRNAVSRAYYAAFLSTRERLIARRRFTPSGHDSVHRELIQSLRSDTDAAMVQIGDLLDTMRVSRNRADYDLAWSPPANIAQYTVLGAQSIIADLDRLFP
jgi:uncharacterized protein (UPF0332 family)